MSPQDTTMENRVQVLDWLCPQQVAAGLMSPAQDRQAANAHPDAGKRFIDSDIFGRWLSHEENRLWCRGPPGAGKTFLVSKVQKYLLEVKKSPSTAEEGSSVAFLYLNYQSRVKENQILGCIIRQLVESQNETHAEIKKLWNNSSGGETTLDGRQLVKLLTSITDNQRVYIVVDALDECPSESRKPLMEALTCLSNKVGLMITSRYMADFERLFTGFHPVNILANRDEIREYIDFCIDENPRLSEFTKWDRDLRADIRMKIVEKSQDMFLLVRLHISSLESADVLDDVREKLNRLSDNLNDMYDGIIQRVKEQTQSRQDIAFNTLGWVAYACRPLRVGELQHALAVRFKDSVFRPGRMLRIEDIIGFCCGLVVVDTQTQTIRLVHFTAKTYMNDRLRKDERFQKFHITMAQVCGTYLCFRNLEQNEDSIERFTWTTLTSNYQESDISYNSIDSADKVEELPYWTKLHVFPFANYAALYLGYHLRQMEAPQSKAAYEAIEQAAILLKVRAKRNFYKQILSSVGAYPPSSRDLVLGRRKHHPTFSNSYYSGLQNNEKPTSADGVPQITREITPLHLAAHTGVSRLAEAFLDDTTMMYIQDFYGCTPLATALYSGHFNVATTFLNAGCNLDIRSPLDADVLLYVAQSTDGQARLIYDVLDRAIGESANPTPKDFSFSIVLFLSMLWTWITTQLLLLYNAIQLTLPRQEMQEALIIPGYYKKTPKIYLADYAPIENEDPDEEEEEKVHSYLKLAWAAHRGDCDTILTLVGSNEVVLTPLEEQSSSHLIVLALFLAVECAHMDVVELLVTSGVNINSTDHNLRTPLHRAAIRRNFAMAEVLLRHGADVQAIDTWMNSPWIMAVTSRDDKLCEILTKHGADVNHRGFHGVHPLYDSAAGGNVNDVKFILNQKVNPSITTNFGWAPLHWAAGNGHMECVRLLLNAGADINPVSDQYKTPLDLVISSERQEIEEVLRAAGGKKADDVLRERGTRYWRDLSTDNPEQQLRRRVFGPQLDI